MSASFHKTSIDIALRIVLASSNMDDSCRVVKIFAIHGWFATRWWITGSDFPVSYNHSDRKLMTNRPAGVTSYSIGLNPSYRNCDSWRYIVQLHRRERIIRSTCAVPFCIPVAIVVCKHRGNGDKGTKLVPPSAPVADT